MGWDVVVMEAVVAHRTGWATTMATTLMDLGGSMQVYASAAVLAIVVAWRGSAWRPVTSALCSCVTGTTIAVITKYLIGRSRPPESWALVHAGGVSMPSSIAALTAATVTPLILAGLRRADLAGRAFAAVLVVITLLVGISMVYLGAHWPSDVLAGWTLGGVVGVGVDRYFELRSPSSGHPFPGSARPATLPTWRTRDGGAVRGDRR